jgi:hypothetical protein
MPEVERAWLGMLISKQHKISNLLLVFTVELMKGIRDAFSELVLTGLGVYIWASLAS